MIAQESQVLQQEMILKSVLTRSGMDNPVVAAARIVPTDHIDVPGAEPVIPVQELMAEALANRPEVEQNQHQPGERRASTCWASRTTCCPR